MINPMELTGKNILITGASSGIGRTTAIYLSRLGGNITMLARNKSRLEKVLDELDKKGEHSLYCIDLKDINVLEKSMDAILQKGIKFDGFVHAAGILCIKPLNSITIQDMNGIMTVNYYSFVELVKILSRKKYRNDHASFVGISSVSSETGSKGYSLYCGSKGALDSSIRALAAELAPKNIRINSVVPGWIETEMLQGVKDTLGEDFENEIKKKQLLGVGQPVDVANLIAFLLSDASRFITGTNIRVDGGYLA